MNAIHHSAEVQVRKSARETEKAVDLATLYDEHSHAVYRLLLAMLGSAADAQDALSEVFLHLARRNLREIHEPRAYLLVSARREALVTLRHRRRETSLTPFVDSFFAIQQLDADQALFARQAEEALETLPAEQREVVVLKIYEGLTFDEIAGLIHIPRNTVASRYRYALERLRKLLKE